MPSFDTIRQDSDNRNLVRKIQKAMAFIAPTSVALPTTLFMAAGALIDLKAVGWLPAGIVTPDGYEFGRDISSDDVAGLGYAGPVRSDISGVARSVTFTAAETGRKHMLELEYGTDLTAVKQGLANGEIIIDEPDLPVGREYRLLVIGIDGPADNQWILGRGYGLVKLASTGSQKWGSGDGVQHSYTLNVFTDDAIGTPVKHYIGGTGAVKQKLALGFAQGTV
ncbi:hypothetical protein [Arthrobacter sp. MP_2.3]|uniref:hypothetical protein n=1 Tax=Arthrobacter sp. MP_2.3 TaxID=3349633 RepID=UPI0038D51447